MATPIRQFCWFWENQKLKTKRKIRIVYAAGPGDVAGTYRAWINGKDDETEFAKTYSGDFFSFCREASARAWVHSTCKRRDRIRDNDVSIHQSPIRWESCGGVWFHLSQVHLAFRIVLSALFARADIVVAGAMVHWWMLSPLKLYGIKVIPTLHCALWPAGHRPTKFDQRVRDKLNGWFWTYIADATIAVSPECQRQVRAISPSSHRRVFQSRAQYCTAVAGEIQQVDPTESPFRVLYAGRIEESKGVFQLIEVASKLEALRPGAIRWTFCGDGSDFGRLSDTVRQHRLTNRVHLTGRQGHLGMLTAYGDCHVVVVPTTHQFSEGLNKVAVEAVIAGRPVITSRYSNAIDVLKDAAVEVPPDNNDGYLQAIVTLMDDHVLYRRCVDSGKEVSQQFFDPNCAWKAALERALLASGIALAMRRDENRYGPATQSRCSVDGPG